MADDVGDVLLSHAGRGQQRDGAVPQLVGVPLAEAGGGDHPVEHAQEVARLDPCADLRREHEPGVHPRRPGGHALLELAPTAHPERVDDGRRRGDRAA